jgi:hypothetical protein
VRTVASRRNVANMAAKHAAAHAATEGAAEVARQAVPSTGAVPAPEETTHSFPTAERGGGSGGREGLLH